MTSRQSMATTSVGGAAEALAAAAQQQAATVAAAGGFSAPMLSWKEVSQCLNELQIACTPEDLQKPTPVLVRNVYEHLVELLGASSREERTQVSFEGASQLEYPELHEESIPELAFYRALIKLMVYIGVTDFTIQRDLLAPDAKRFRRNLAALINFLKFREQHLMPFCEASDMAGQLMMQRAQLQELRDELEATKAAMLAKRDEEEPTVRRLEAETAAIEAELQMLNKQQAGLRAEAHAMKETSAALVEKMNEEQVLLLSTRAEVARMKSLVVPDPERMRKLIQELADSVSTEKENLAAAEQRCREMQARADAAAKVDKDVSKNAVLLDDFEAELTRRKKASADVKARRAAVQALEQRFRDESATEQHLQRQLQSVQEKQQRQQRQHSLKMQAAAQTLDDVRAIKAAADADKANADLVVERNDACAKTMQRRMDELTRNHEQELATLEERYTQLEDTVRQYHAELFATIKSGNAPAAAAAAAAGSRA